jgi:translation initiation factor 1 (eIF-1/SUI1)
MAKKPKDERAPVSAPLANNPFAKLAGMELPPGQVIEEPAAQTAKPPALFDAKVVVRREVKGRGGKTVTRITGIAAAHRERLTTEMKKQLGCGATLEDDDVLLLGSLVDRAAEWLEAHGAKRVVRSP